MIDKSLQGLKVTIQHKKKAPTINPNLADFAEAAYTQKPMPGYFIDTELSGPDRTVYHDGVHAIVAFKGTTPSSRRDIETDAALWAGFQSQTNRFRNSLDVTKRAITKYGKDNVYVTGHSLGGSQSIYVHQETGVQGSSYSPYIDTRSAISHKGHFVGPNFHVHAIVGDPVALGTVHHLLGEKNVHLYTPMSKYEKIVKPILMPNPLSKEFGANPYVSTAAKALGVVSTGQKVLSLHDIGNFTSSSTYGEKVRSRDVSLPRTQKYASGPPEETSFHPIPTPIIHDISSIGTQNVTHEINYWSVQ